MIEGKALDIDEPVTKYLYGNYNIREVINNFSYEFKNSVNELEHKCDRLLTTNKNGPGQRRQ